MAQPPKRGQETDRHGQHLRIRGLGQVAQTPGLCVRVDRDADSNRLIDLWGQIAVIEQGARLGTSKQRFLSRWFDAIQTGPDPHARKYMPQEDSEEEILELIADITVSMTARDYIELPPTIPVPHYVDLMAKQMKDTAGLSGNWRWRNTTSRQSTRAS
jgi:hypothetical protein